MSFVVRMILICVAAGIIEYTGELGIPVSELFRRALSFDFLLDSG